MNCLLLGGWGVGRTIFFSLHADIAIVVDTRRTPRPSTFGIEVTLQPRSDCKIAAGHRNGYSGGVTSGICYS
jgi:hypothetical protein